MVEISTGNTPEISTELRSKSGILVDFGGEISIFRLQILLPVEISTGPKFLKIEKYGISVPFCTLNQYRNPKTRKSRARQSWWISTKSNLTFQILKFLISGSEIGFSTNFDERQIFKF